MRRVITPVCAPTLQFVLQPCRKHCTLKSALRLDVVTEHINFSVQVLLHASLALCSFCFADAADAADSVLTTITVFLFFFS